MRPGKHPALIDPDRFDCLLVKRAGRDRTRAARAKASAAKRGSLGGRPTVNFALAKLGRCGRCGERMYARTSPYKRKDGTHARYYLCANVHGQTGSCDQPKVPAAVIDAAVVDYLDQLFIDVEAWSRQLAAGTDEAHRSASLALDSATAALAKDEATESKLRTRYLVAVSADDDSAADLNLDLLNELQAKIDAARDSVGALRANVAELAEQDEPTDAMLDLYIDLRRTIGGGEGSLADLNERLREEVEEFRIDTLDDGTVEVLPVLQPRPLDAAEIAALYDAWHEGGEQAPTAEEERDYWAHERREEPFLTRPPTVPLSVVATKPGNAQESWHPK